MADIVHPPRPTTGRLSEVWEKPVSEIVSITAPALKEEQIERHSLYCNLLMSLVASYWNGNKRGREGKYPWREKQLRPDKYGYLGGDYLGHNIAAIAVDAEGEVIDFDFNHNEIMNSSVEHAEARLVRRVFGLTGLYNGWALEDPSKKPPVPYSNVLNGVTIYTSLESCSQCSGIMALGYVKEVVFLQRDPGQYSIGNILRHLTKNEKYPAPVPIPADIIGVDYFERLEKGYAEFSAGVANKPFHEDPAGKVDKSPSITSFLCTDLAMGIFLDGQDRFLKTLKAKYPDYKPVNDKKVLSNTDLITHLHRFHSYAISDGRRGTSH
ncbi:MAG: hypothetical protein K2V38_00100 [Gemmataceae bacterium]|nr:hypothetical protein [Gemmataceae bacterium]